MRRMNVILLGYRGCGKSTIGRGVAERLGLDFVDLDDVVRAAFGGKTVAEIWQTQGEAAFRAAEVDAVQQVLSVDGQVIALGGGTPMQDGAEAALLAAESGLRVYLKAQPATLVARIEGDSQTASLRPSLTGAASATGEAEQVLRQREPTYQRVADHVVDVDLLPINEAVDAICRLCDA